MSARRRREILATAHGLFLAWLELALLHRSALLASNPSRSSGEELAHRHAIEACVDGVEVEATIQHERAVKF